jgi:putative transposase
MSEEEKPSITKMAEFLGVSRGSFYYQRKLERRDELLKDEIEHVLKENPSYGYKNIALALRRNKKPILRVMRKYGLRSECYPSGKKKSQRKRKSPTCHPNLIE